MAIRSGTLLEKDVERIFKLAGFQTQHQARMKGYEIDVYAVHGGFSVAIECKQFEKSTLNLRNLIHVWNSKNNEIGSSKVLLVLWGFEIPDSIMALAEKYSMKIWNHNDVDHFLDELIENKEKGTRLLLQNLGTNMSEFDSLGEETKKLREIFEEDKGVYPLNHEKHKTKASTFGKLIENNIKRIRLGIKEAEGFREQDLDIQEMTKGLRDCVNSLYSMVYRSILATLKNGFLDPRNKIPDKELREFEKFFKKWDKYVGKDNNDASITKDEYIKFRKKIKEMDDAKIIENFYKILQKIEKMFNMDENISKIDKANEEIVHFYKQNN